MDPNANVEERIGLLLGKRHNGGNWRSSCDPARYTELQDAYAQWRAKGGFAAPEPALNWLRELVESELIQG